MRPDEKTCPRCAETVKHAALVCRYCGHEFEKVDAAEEGVVEAPEDASPASPPEGSFGKALFIVIAVIGLIALIARCAVSSQQADNLADESMNFATEAPNSALENADEALANASNVSSESLSAPQASVADSSESGVPAFDTVAHCRAVSEVGGSGSYTIEETCRNIEADARAELASLSIPDRVYQHCKEVAEVGGAGSYSIMKTCVDMEMGAAGRL